MAETGLCADTALSDHRVSPQVNRDGVMHDADFATFGLTADLVEEALHRAMSVAENGGFLVKGVESVAMHGDFTGVRFDGERGRASVTPKRIWRLRFAILELLHLDKFDGVRLTKWTGHFTYVALLRRDTFCIFSAAYVFIYASGGVPTRLWPSVRRELEWAGAVLPLIFADFLTLGHRSSTRRTPPRARRTASA